MVIALGGAVRHGPRLASPPVHGFHGGGFRGGGWGGGGGWGYYGGGIAAGAILGGLLAAPYYYGAAYYYSVPGYYDDGGCYLIRRRVMTRYGWPPASSPSVRLNALSSKDGRRFTPPDLL
jgi:hypothetical protein